jgi:predicted small integral membrane protein
MIVRLSKALLVCAIALFASLVAFGNITDYGTNFAFVRHVFMMDTLFPDATITYRAIHAPWLHQVGYIGIIVLETLTAILCWIGGIRLLCGLKLPAALFNRSKSFAIAGLTLGFLTWQVAFMSVGGEWFGMWMSKQWNGVPDAFRFFVTILLVLIYLVPRDGELGE